MNFGNNGNGHQQFDRAQRIAYLVAGYVRNTLSEKERDELDDWICEDDANQDKFLELIDPAFLDQALQERQSYNSSKAIERIREKLQFGQPVTSPVKPIRRWLAPLSAAAVLLLAILLYWLWRPSNIPDSSYAATSLASLQPGSSKAILSVAGGKDYVLDSLKETIAPTNGLLVEKEAGQLSYNHATGEAQLHTVTVPRGAQYKLQLPDGTRVWLNAESSISFPSVMAGDERVVEVTGELFFDVTKDPTRKFIVRSDKLITEVLGTRFNVNLHGVNGRSAVFLQEGSVKVFAGKDKAVAHILQPGFLLSSDNQQVSIARAHEEEILAWKNGWFEFRDSPIETIMEEVKRWYDVEVKYEGRINYHFNASIERNLPAAGLLELLEMTGHVKFQYKDGTIIVKP